MTIDATTLKAMFAAIATAIEADRDRLCALDGVIGDADHGIAMELGFNAARDTVAALDQAVEPSVVFNAAAKSFLNAVGASSGPLYATAFMRAGVAIKGKATLSDADFVAAFQAMAQGIRDRGKAEPGEKTMIDAWVPAAAAAGNALAEGKAEPGEKTMIDAWAPAAAAAGNALAEGKAAAATIDAAAKAAADGAEATKDMVAAKGRSARLGDRSIGHVDPGAASAVTVIRAIAGSLRG